MKASSLGVALFVAVAVGCSDSGDSTGPASPSDFVGDWLASSYVVTSVANTSQTQDLTALGMTLAITFTETTYSGSASFPGEVTETFSGTYTISGNQLTLNETGEGTPEIMTYTLSGNTLTLSGDDEQYDFDDDGQDEPATFTTVLARQ
ncbi:MAG: lipocalin family protein [Gemmatimonadetes bacterium]|nr:lipocalin family protein [Gemmatimonadota bacterium]